MTALRFPKIDVRFFARVFSIVLFFFWGSFFVEHLSWFTSIQGKIPPATVWALSILHGLLLVSYAVSLRWERTGSIGIVLCSVSFFSFTAGYNALPFIVVSCSPAMLYLYLWKREHKAPPTDPGA